MTPVELQQLKRIADELKESGITDFNQEPKRDPNVIYPPAAVKIRKKLLEQPDYTRKERVRKLIGDRRLTSASASIIVTCLSPYQDEFCVWALDRIEDPENFLKKIKPSFSYDHVYRNVVKEFKILQSAGLLESYEPENVIAPTKKSLFSKYKNHMIGLSLGLAFGLAFGILVGFLL